MWTNPLAHNNAVYKSFLLSSVLGFHLAVRTSRASLTDQLVADVMLSPPPSPLQKSVTGLSHVTREDQSKINKFARLNAKRQDLQEEIKEKEVRKSVLWKYFRKTRHQHSSLCFFRCPWNVKRFCLALLFCMLYIYYSEHEARSLSPGGLMKNYQYDLTAWSGTARPVWPWYWLWYLCLRIWTIFPYFPLVACTRHGREISLRHQNIPMS